jgi:hypothetical protein
LLSISTLPLSVIKGRVLAAVCCQHGVSWPAFYRVQEMSRAQNQSRSKSGPFYLEKKLIGVKKYSVMSVLVAAANALTGISNAQDTIATSTPSSLMKQHTFSQRQKRRRQKPSQLVMLKMHTRGVTHEKLTCNS